MPEIILIKAKERITNPRQLWETTSIKNPRKYK